MCLADRADRPTLDASMPRALALLSLVLLVLGAGCGRRDDGDATSTPDAVITVATTTRQVADFARAVGGARVRVEAIIPANADPHDFEPRPSDARLVARADVVLRSGGDVDAWLGDLVENAGGDAAVVDLIDVVRTRAGDEHAGEADPHWWQDPRNVEVAAKRIEQAFAEADPAGIDAYARATRTYVARLAMLDTRIARCFAAVPASRRRLVTNHDAYGYFAGRYGIAVLGSIFPALSTTAQPSAGDVRRLVAAIRRTGVTTIFPESTLSQRLESAVARDAGVRVGEPLYADVLPRGVAYVDALAHDARLIGASMGADCAV